MVPDTTSAALRIRSGSCARSWVSAKSHTRRSKVLVLLKQVVSAKQEGPRTSINPSSAAALCLAPMPRCASNKAEANSAFDEVPHTEQSMLLTAPARSGTDVLNEAKAKTSACAALGWRSPSLATKCLAAARVALARKVKTNRADNQPSSPCRHADCTTSAWPLSDNFMTCATEIADIFLTAKITVSNASRGKVPCAWRPVAVSMSNALHFAML
mmetsp:Transcript_94495/g.273166  ORF Transcript_94495/g.273166 Transcript_94495/m.273166 type:complete len:214 (+) Transcript_94495:585-1226(+)